MPKVLIADKLSPAAVAIFQERGVEADVKTGLSKDELLKIIDQYDGLAVRSASASSASSSARSPRRCGRRCSRSTCCWRRWTRRAGWWR